MVRAEHENNVHGPVSLRELPIKKKGREGLCFFTSITESQECNFVERILRSITSLHFQVPFK